MENAENWQTFRRLWSSSIIIITAIIISSIIITAIIVITIITIRWRTPKTVKLSAVCGAAPSVSRGGSMTSRKIFTGSVQLILIIMIIIDQDDHCDCQELPHT